MRMIAGLAFVVLLVLSACTGRSAVLTRDQSILKVAAESVLQMEKLSRAGTPGPYDAVTEPLNRRANLLVAENRLSEVEEKSLSAELRSHQLRPSSELGMVNASLGLSHMDLELLKAKVSLAGNTWALYEFRFRTGNNAAKEDMLKARQEFDEAIKKIIEPLVRVQIAFNKQITQEELEKDAKIQVLGEMALTGDLQRARDGVEIATNTVLIEMLNTQLPLLRAVIQKTDLNGLLDSRATLEGQIEAVRTKDSASPSAERHAAEVKKAAETPELRASRQALAVALQSAAKSR